MRRFLCAMVLTVAVLGGSAALAEGPRTALQAMALRLPEVKFEGTRFADAIEHLRNVSGANFTVNWRALETVGVTRDTPVTFTAKRISLRKAIQLVLSQSSNPGELTFYNDGGVIEITTRALGDDLMLTRIYDVQDLLILPMTLGGNGGGNATTGGGGNGRSGSVSSGGGRGSSGGQNDSGSMMARSSRTFGGNTGGGAGGGTSSSSRTGRGGTGGTSGGDDRAALGEELASIITGTIEPDIWQENGGRSSIRYFRGNLIISAPRRIHELIGGPFE